MDVIDLWWLSLGVFAVVVVVVAVLLGLVIAAARQVDRHAGGIWAEGKQIAGNTVSIWTLEKTNEYLDEIRESVRSLDGTLGSLDETLQALGGAGGRRGA